ncbi:hypothetical protein Bhyg_13433 [Pseudolycoriella hygida]|uniref:Uncharacterized protein n=1 Tax=Pseudolycoriella hygida TaxID=35572 RepID=A0A9Q0MRA9_9DIPT|nr:hypothetical protein Bhyg_13433 [Pseudolycoriella hygida]
MGVANSDANTTLLLRHNSLKLYRCEAWSLSFERTISIQYSYQLCGIIWSRDLKYSYVPVTEIIIHLPLTASVLMCFALFILSLWNELDSIFDYATKNKFATDKYENVGTAHSSSKEILTLTENITSQMIFSKDTTENDMAFAVLSAFTLVELLFTEYFTFQT